MSAKTTLVQRFVSLRFARKMVKIKNYLEYF